MKLLPKILSKVTGHSRQIFAWDDIKWSRGKYVKERPRARAKVVWRPACWTHNAFRLYEYYFGRRDGIKAEMSAKRDSKGVEIYTCHSWESVFALAEHFVRIFFKAHKLIPFKIFIPILQTASGFPVFASPYLFAIAFDNSNSTGNPAGTFAYVVTGSNPKIFVNGTGDVTGTDNITAVSYAVGALTKIGGVQKPSDRFQDLWYRDNPATGSNNVAITAGGLGANSAIVTSYSGCRTGIDSSHTGTATAASTITISTTVVATGCWLVGAIGNSNGAQTAGAGTTQRVAGSDGNGGQDSNGTVSTGSQSLIMNRAGSNNWGGVIVSIAPFTTDPTFDAQTSNGASGTGTTTYSGTHTPVSSTNLSAYVWVVSTGSDPSAATYGGDAMTKVSTTGTVSAVGTGSLWVKPGCKTGAQTVVVTKLSADNVYTVFTTYFNTNQTTQCDVVAASKSTLASTTIAPSLTTLTDNSRTVVFLGNSGSSASAGASTQVESAWNVSSGNAVLDGTAVIHPAGSSTLNVSDGSCNWAYIMTTVMPVASAANTGQWFGS